MSQTATARFEARVKPEIYEILKQAATMTGRTLTDFIVSSAYQEAKKTINEHSQLTLSMRDQQTFWQALNSPNKPNAAMEKAKARHQALLNGQNNV
ncbi:DUF1778 domain-containing protein [Lonepinella koalarum]|uniref:type II toxin-antitoxin system TacA family antitoxin n=1 Tax=Lonepinella koalarum TaxID=53417 RepID=UPI003F6DD43E